MDRNEYTYLPFYATFLRLPRGVIYFYYGSFYFFCAFLLFVSELFLSVVRYLIVLPAIIGLTNGIKCFRPKSKLIEDLPFHATFLRLPRGVLHFYYGSFYFFFTFLLFVSELFLSFVRHEEVYLSWRACISLCGASLNIWLQVLSVLELFLDFFVKVHGTLFVVLAQLFYAAGALFFHTICVLFTGSGEPDSFTFSDVAWLFLADCASSIASIRLDLGATLRKNEAPLQFYFYSTAAFRYFVDNFVLFG
jgi:hypothetical protein